MSELTFEYGTISIGDIVVDTKPNPAKPNRKIVNHVVINGRMVVPSDRFWQSLCSLYSEFGVTKGLYNLFDHDEVFSRLSERSPNDRIRYTIQHESNHAPILLAAIRPEKAVITYERLMGILSRFSGERITYMDGEVNSVHTPRIGASNYWVECPITSIRHEFMNRFLLTVPIDGYGKPSVFPSVERMHDGVQYITRNATALKVELALGRGMDVVENSVCRVLDSFNTDEGYATVRNRIEVSMGSWLSMYEASQSYKLLVRELSGIRITGQAKDDVTNGTGLISQFHALTGDTSRIYGIATLDSLAAKKQRNLPVNCTVYEMISFLADVATHRAIEAGRQNIHCFVGQMMGDKEGYDMEGTRYYQDERTGKLKTKWPYFNDFRVHTDIRGIMEGKAIPEQVIGEEISDDDAPAEEISAEEISDEEISAEETPDASITDEEIPDNQG